VARILGLDGGIAPRHPPWRAPELAWRGRRGRPRRHDGLRRQVPGVAKLDADLLSALRRAATDAAAGGVRLYVDSGWRSPAYQERLLREAVSKYGSEEAATRWVATPETSEHVKGDAIDLAPSGAAWLSAHGAGYGLCQIYGNEPWHYELRPEAVHDGCPPM
jgi:zinc D-Ala-D-Ala carboxypeptidase